MITAITGPPHVDVLGEPSRQPTQARGPAIVGPLMIEVPRAGPGRAEPAHRLGR